jgi:hypothetical protein
VHPRHGRWRPEDDACDDTERSRLSYERHLSNEGGRSLWIDRHCGWCYQRSRVWIASAHRDRRVLAASGDSAPVREEYRGGRGYVGFVGGTC